jgi:hypothetical protein
MPGMLSPAGSCEGARNAEEALQHKARRVHRRRCGAGAGSVGTAGGKQRQEQGGPRWDIWGML